MMLTEDEINLIDMALCDSARVVARNMADRLLVAENITTGAQHMLKLATLAARVHGLARTKPMTDAEIVEQAIRLAASTVDSTEQVKFYLLRVADEIARVLAKRKP